MAPSNPQGSGPRLSDFISDAGAYPFLVEGAPWAVTDAAPRIVADLIATLGPDFHIADGIAVHRTAQVEAGAVLKGPVVIGARCFVASSAYLRGGVFMAEDCIVGPAAELKTSFMLPFAKLAHLNFVGDSILGARVNCEAGSMVANYRNERDDKRIRIVWRDEVLDTGVEKFGALMGDHVRLGANAVVAPGAILAPGAIVPRLGLVDQAPPAQDRNGPRRETEA